MFQVFGQMVVCDVENPQPEPCMYAGDDSVLPGSSEAASSEPVRLLLSLKSTESH